MKGVPNKATREIKAFWHDFFRSPAYREAAAARVQAGSAPTLEIYLLQLIYGKPVEVQEHIGDPRRPIGVIHVHEP